MSYRSSKYHMLWQNQTGTQKVSKILPLSSRSISSWRHCGISSLIQPWNAAGIYPHTWTLGTLQQHQLSGRLSSPLPWHLTRRAYTHRREPQQGSRFFKYTWRRWSPRPSSPPSWSCTPCWFCAWTREMVSQHQRSVGYGESLNKVGGQSPLPFLGSTTRYCGYFLIFYRYLWMHLEFY